MMERDRRLTGSTRGQTVSVELSSLCIVELSVNHPVVISSDSARSIG